MIVDDCIMCVGVGRCLCVSVCRLDCCSLSVFICLTTAAYVCLGFPVAGGVICICVMGGLFCILLVDCLRNCSFFQFVPWTGCPSLGLYLLGCTYVALCCCIP